jgi:hypothetical protein
MIALRFTALAAVLTALLACTPESPTAKVAAVPAPAPIETASQADHVKPEPGSNEPDASIDDHADEPIIPHVVGWWNNAEILSRLNLPEDKSAALVAHLKNLELSYQLAQSRLKQARHEQTRMIEDPAATRADIERLNREQLQTLSISMLELNIEARLWVREQLSDQQIASMLKVAPGFFRARWFRPSRAPMRQGQVKEDKS